jgi:hypothetical protein
MTGGLGRLTLNLQRVSSRILRDDPLEGFVPRAFLDLWTDPNETAARLYAQQLGEDRVETAVPAERGRAGANSLWLPAPVGTRPPTGSAPVTLLHRPVGAAASRAPHTAVAGESSVRAARPSSRPVDSIRDEAGSQDVDGAALSPFRGAGQTPAGGRLLQSAPATSIVSPAPEQASSHDAFIRSSSGRSGTVESQPADGRDDGSDDLRRPPSIGQAPPRRRSVHPDAGPTRLVSGAAALSALLTSSTRPVPLAGTDVTPDRMPPSMPDRPVPVSSHSRGDAAGAPPEPPPVASESAAKAHHAPFDIDDLFDELERRLEFEYVRAYGRSTG